MSKRILYGPFLLLTENGRPVAFPIQQIKRVFHLTEPTAGGAVTGVELISEDVNMWHGVQEPIMQILACFPEPRQPAMMPGGQPYPMAGTPPGVNPEWSQGRPVNRPTPATQPNPSGVYQGPRDPHRPPQV